MLRVFVPSCARHAVPELSRGPLAKALPETRGLATYVVPSEQVPLYTKSLDALGWLKEGVGVLGCARKGIAGTRNFIGQYAQKKRTPKFLMVDDDVHWLIRRAPDTWRMRKAEGVEIATLLNQIENLLEKYGHVGVSTREGNNHLGNGPPESLLAENTRLLRALAYRTEDFLSVKHERVVVMEDFDVTLQLLKKGIPNANIGYWAQGQAMTNAPGGCSTYRTHQVHEESAKKLAQLHPGLVTLRQKANKTDADGFGSRTEVTIRWKAALRPTRGILF